MSGSRAGWWLRNSARMGVGCLLLACANLSAQAPASTVPAMPWVRIPAGSFQMGCVPSDTRCEADEQPRHPVTISRPFDLMATEVTVGMYRATSPPAPLEQQQPVWTPTPEHPVTIVNWNEARTFCEAVGGRLPDRSRVGIRRTRRPRRCGLPMGRSTADRSAWSGQRRRFRIRFAQACAFLRAEWLRAVRHGRQRVGVGGGLVRAIRARVANRSSRARFGPSACRPRRVVWRRRRQPAPLEPQRQPAAQPQSQHRIPVRPRRIAVAQADALIRAAPDARRKWRSTLHRRLTPPA